MKKQKLRRSGNLFLLILVLGSLLLGSLWVAGCQSSSAIPAQSASDETNTADTNAADANTTDTNSTENKSVSLEAWIFFDENTPGTYYVDLWKELAEKNGYELNLKTYSTEQIKDKLSISLACGELPDIFAVWGGNYPNFLFDAGACLPVQDYLSRAEISFEDAYVEPYTDGNNYIIPCLVEAYAVTYCNQNLMKEIGLTMPKTWEELIDLVEKVNTYNQTHGTNYAAIELGDKDNWLGELLYDMIVNRTDPEAQKKLASGQLSFSDAVFSNSVEKLCQLRDMGAFPSNFLETGEVEAIDNFIQGDAVLFPHQSTILYHLLDSMGADAFSMESFPSCSDTFDPAYTTYLMDINHTRTPGLCVSSKTAYPDEAATLCLEFAKEVNSRNVTEYGYVDFQKDSGLSPLAEQPYPVTQFQNLLKHAKAYTPFWYAVMEKTDGDNWRNLTKKLLGNAISKKEFLIEGKKYLKFTDE